jgi:hypothetical protein
MDGSLAIDVDTPTLTVGDAAGTYAAGAGQLGSSPRRRRVPVAERDVRQPRDRRQRNADDHRNHSTFTRISDFSEGSVTDDFTDDGIANPVTIEFTLTFDPTDPEIYDLQVQTPPPMVVLTTSGALKAGGPDAVQTLLFGGTPPSPST